ncbi:MAG: hypothetical protein BAJATHORv1_60159 [Candidatus Thorarchaeota archaeon]|nr:MAG: hypothetical protein BAJATHORv1_60159 [Candidatus Thorarchaeota archaeon]
MFYETVQESPRIAQKDYATAFSKGLVPDEENTWLGMVFRGSGVPLEEHPCKDRLHMHGCKNCGSDNVLVIYAQWSVSTHSGDSYWDYEIICNECRMFTARSFNEND